MTSPHYDAGLAMRQQVLGADYVAQTLDEAGDLLQPFQALLTEFAWGQVWTRPGLDLRTRSLLTLAMCIALNRPREIRIHLRGAIRNGVAAAEIRELLIHAFVYCGGPASVDAFHVIRTALPEIEAREKAGSAPPASPATAP